jgi:hypothetical protein
MSPGIVANSPKYSQQELQKIAATVPMVYDRMAQGWSDGDFDAARQSADPTEQQIGRAYHMLWQNPAPSVSLHAHLEGNVLEIDSGNHRIQAAQQIGVPVVPVNVSAPTRQELDRIETSCQQQIRREGNVSYRQAQEMHEAQLTQKSMTMEERLSQPMMPEHDFQHGIRSAPQQVQDMYQHYGSKKKLQAEAQREPSQSRDRDSGPSLDTRQDR